MGRSPSGFERPTAAGVDRDAVVAAALALATERGWEGISLRDIARRAGVALADLYAAYPGKPAILAALTEQVDETVLEAHAGGAEDEPGTGQAAAGSPDDSAAEPARDRLFDVLMTRFDQLQPHRAALQRILPTYRSDPALALGGLCQLRTSMRRMLEAAGLDSHGLRGELRLAVLCTVYLATLRVWLHDESTDMARTMATLDGYLRRLERPAAMLEGVRRPRVRPGAEGRPDAADDTAATPGASNI